MKSRRHQADIMSLGLKYRNGTLNLSLKLQSVIFIDIDTLDLPLATLHILELLDFPRFSSDFLDFHATILHERDVLSTGKGRKAGRSRSKT